MIRLPIAEEASFYAEWLQRKEYRGLGDTREAARSRVARRVGVPDSYLKRLRYEAREMRDVAGSHYRTLRAAYEAAVQREADRAAVARAEREAIERVLSTGSKPASSLVGRVAPSPCATASGEDD